MIPPSARTPVSRLAAVVSEGDDLDLRLSLPVNDGVRKPTQWQAPRTAFARYLRDVPAKTRMALDQFQRALNLGKEFCAKSGAFLFVPSDGRAEFVSGRFLNAEALPHLRRISASIWRRTSFQAVVPVVPASSAAHRRSISAAHASWTPAASLSRASRLSISRVAISARSCSERPSASCKILSAVVVMNGIVAPRSKLPKPLHPPAAMQQRGGTTGAFRRRG